MLELQEGKITTSYYRITHGNSVIQTTNNYSTVAATTVRLGRLSANCADA